MRKAMLKTKFSRLVVLVGVLAPHVTSINGHIALVAISPVRARQQ